jgi:CMP/dCMP kinase
MSAISSPFVVTIDGPAGAGKSTTALMLADALGYVFLDTGAIYRTVALLSKKAGIAWDEPVPLGRIAAEMELRFVPGEGGVHVFANGTDVTSEIRAPDISQGASKVSAHAPVRDALLGLQRRIGAVGRVVAEGRDTGTVVFPTAQAKFYLTADARVRAERRSAELAKKGTVVSIEETLKEILERDARDSERSVAPLKKADDAIEVDTGISGADQVVSQLVRVVRARGG